MIVLLQNFLERVDQISWHLKYESENKETDYF